MGVLWSVAIFFALFWTVNKLWCFWCRSKVCLVGKTAIITGGASGLGYQTALHLAARGCKVIIGDVADTTKPVQELVKETQNPNIIGKHLNLESYESVRAFAKDIIATEERLDILLCNAGISDYIFYNRSNDGVEKTMQINYFGHFLLTHLLIDLLKKSAPSRIVFTSSLLAYTCDMTPENLNPSESYFNIYQKTVSGKLYCISKLALTTAAKSFGEKLRGTGVTANSVHPGCVRTSIYTSAFKLNLSFGVILLGALTYFYGKTPEQGCQTLVHVATSESVKNVTAQAFWEGMRIPRPFKLRRAEFCDKIWDLSVKYTKLEPHEVAC